MTTPAAIKELLCKQWCTSAVVAEDRAGLRLSLPMYEADGDAVTVWIRPSLGGWEIADQGTTYMRLSYEMDLDLLETPQRAKVLENILRESGLEDRSGNLVMKVIEDDLGVALFSFGQAIARISDIKLWNKTRVANTFYDDLAHELTRIAGKENIEVNYQIPGMENAADYPIDFYIKGGHSPLYIFGIPTGDKAKLATIILQKLASQGHFFESLIVPSDLSAIPQRDLRRLMNAANDMVDSVTAKEPLERKIRHRLAA